MVGCLKSSDFYSSESVLELTPHSSSKKGYQLPTIHETYAACLRSREEMRNSEGTFPCPPLASDLGLRAVECMISILCIIHLLGLFEFQMRLH